MSKIWRRERSLGDCEDIGRRERWSGGGWEGKRSKGTWMENTRAKQRQQIAKKREAKQESRGGREQDVQRGLNEQLRKRLRSSLEWPLPSSRAATSIFQRSSSSSPCAPQFGSFFPSRPATQAHHSRAAPACSAELGRPKCETGGLACRTFGTLQSRRRHRGIKNKVR
ncbi:hypothetical protein HPB48_014326 [Haemaphysalis longicornis]|uniref:Uncharacterized protein n=1 Tax=Haemaphysalis longicornis TaxID=44386 RepID=A0A9J6FTK7_HAELO|nr:hypothetical protein HPB48_014326 [Haemaphysalis longicornis]